MPFPVEISGLPDNASLETNQQTIGTSKEVISVVLSDRIVRGILVKALNTNSDIIYVGDSSVTTSTGFPLSAGESVVIPLNNGSIYAVADAAAQKLAWMIV